MWPAPECPKASDEARITYDTPRMHPGTCKASREAPKGHPGNAPETPEVLPEAPRRHQRNTQKPPKRELSRHRRSDSISGRAAIIENKKTTILIRFLQWKLRAMKS